MAEQLPEVPSIKMDTLTPEQRSKRMALVKNKDTKPELRVRHLTHALGFRYRLHVQELPGKPDLVFPSKYKVILVHGCFWHRHHGCSRTRLPKSRLEFWRPKLLENARRDREKIKKLRRLGFGVLVVWECETENPKMLRDILLGFLGESGSKEAH